MYYIVETNYVGPNRTQGQYVDADRIEIRTSPAITNMSHEQRAEGWCGTTNDWSVYAHGEYASFDNAQAAIAETFGEVREFEPDDEAVVEIYRRGKYEPMSRQATADWVYAAAEFDLSANTTDERIAQLVADYEFEANSNGYTLDSDLEEILQELRDELKDAA